MMDKKHLHFLITEEIYDIGSTPSPSNHGSSEPTEKNPPQGERQNPTPPPPQPSAKKLGLAIFHESTDEEEINLLREIIDACKLDPSAYEVFANGFNTEVTFDKALVFVGKAKSFYKAIHYKNSKILCAKPLGEIINNKPEKLKLWNALQTYL